MSSPPFGELIDQFEKLPEDQWDLLVEAVDVRFRDSGRKAPVSEPREPLHFATLARHVHYYAVSLGEAKRGSTARLQPQWTTLKEQYDSFRAAYPFLKRALPEIEEDDLRLFCSFSTRRQGSRTTGFYLALALFLIRQDERGGSEPREFLSVVLPACETQFLEEVRREIVHWLNVRADRHHQDRPFPKILPPRRAREHPEVELSFAYRNQWIEKFEGHFEHYSVPTEPDRLGLHLVLYRGREGCPQDLVKSFLALVPGKADPLRGQQNVYRSVHVYRPARQDWGHPRLSLGWMIPLERGLYILGGQKAEPERAGAQASRAPRKPFRALEVLYFSWRSLDSRLLYGLAMSLNNDGTPLISRICARPTPLNRSDRLQLGSVSVVDLTESIADDDRRAMALVDEGSIPPEVLARFSLDQPSESRAELARIIAHHCNNAPLSPRDWDLNAADAARDFSCGAATAAALATQLDDLILGGDTLSSPIDGRPMGFWGGLRIGPLTNDGN
jgi:hypothetical protein